MIKVVKFGGSSLADAVQIKKAGKIVLSEESRRYVVPSAPGKRFSDDTKVTDMLYRCYGAAVKEKKFTELLADIQKRYQEIIEGLGITLSLDEEFATIRDNFAKKIGRDYAASRGEYLNGRVIAAYLGYEFIDAVEVIKFDENGNFLSEETNQVLADRLSKVERAVIPGFYGARPDGTIQTFSRGGSDVTGSIVARATHADMYENWTDVSGFLIADPRIIKNPKGIEAITYKELRELSYMGASVLHEDAIFPVRKEGIPINIRNTNAPEEKGTLIVEGTCRKPKYTITGIAGKRGFASITIEKAMMNSEVGFGRKVLGVFEDEGISFEHMPSGIDTMTIFVHQDEFEEHEQKVLAGIHRAVSRDFETSQLMGIKINSVISMTFVIGSFLAGVASILYFANYGQVSPMIGAMPGLKAFVAAVFGGIGSIPGAVIGAFIIGICESFIKANETIAVFSNAFTFALLIVILLCKPNGLFGEKLTEKV